MSCFTACCTIEKKGILPGSPGSPTKGRFTPKGPASPGGKEGSASPEDNEAQGEGDDDGLAVGDYKSMGCTRRGGSHIVARRNSEIDGPPEATPEPCSLAAGSPFCLATASEVMKAIGNLEGIMEGADCEACFLSMSTPGKWKAAAVIEPEFEEKKCESMGGAQRLREVRERLLQEGVGIACRKGKKPEQPNQDSFFFADTARFRLCCVADGHGEFGHWVSHWVVRMTLKALLMELANAEGLPQDDAVAQIFDVIHKCLKLKAATEGFDLLLSGTTLSIAIVDRTTQQALTAWAGDSRCVCGRPPAGGGSKPEVISATNDHKPQDAEERRRIIGSGGEVIRLPNDVPHRVFVRGRESPGLAMSRAVGDLLAHSVGVNHVPGFKRFNLEEGSVLLCCSDGVWEFIKNMEALGVATKHGIAGVGEAVRQLAQESRNRWLKEEVSVTDDITVIAMWGAPKRAHPTAPA
mmetsp:Transcript_29291/g.97372  ORF Transcript_29291/g.97372 Transcript_29291/m.97372 type:complete len:465 (-) Transcript_29291:15-1409(-)